MPNPSEEQLPVEDDEKMFDDYCIPLSKRTPQTREAFIKWIDEIGQYKEYDSFRTNRFYRDLEKTASGVIADALATTRNLSRDEREQHRLAQQIFAAFCLRYCMLKLANPENIGVSREAAELLGEDAAINIYLEVYSKIVSKLKQKINDGEAFQNVRNWIVSITAFKAKDAIRRLTAEKRCNPTNNENSFSLDDEKWSNIFSEQVQDEIVEFGLSHTSKEMDRLMLEDFISRAELSEEELSILCYSYGLGDFDRITLEEIAKRLPPNDKGEPVNASTVKRRRDNILDKLRNLLLEN